MTVFIFDNTYSRSSFFNRLCLVRVPKSSASKTWSTSFKAVCRFTLIYVIRPQVVLPAVVYHVYQRLSFVLSRVSKLGV